MLTYRTCDGCKWFRASIRGLECLAPFTCKHNKTSKADLMAAEGLRWRVMSRTPEDGMRKETR